MIDGGRQPAAARSHERRGKARPRSALASHEPRCQRMGYYGHGKYPPPAAGHARRASQAKSMQVTDGSSQTG
eukprot:11071286-Heterocapsa_arctica.AAC.1